MRTTYLALSLLSILVIIFGCNTSKETTNDQLPNILWITTEDITPMLGCYGDPVASTPNLDKLAEKGIQFNNAFSTAPVCAPARSCLVTGVSATSWRKHIE